MKKAILACVGMCLLVFTGRNNVAEVSNKIFPRASDLGKTLLQESC